MVEVEVPLQFSSDNDPVLNIDNIRLLLIEDPQDTKNIFIVLFADVTITLEKNEMNTTVMLVLLVPGMDASRLLVSKSSRNIFSKSFSLVPKLTTIEKASLQSKINSEITVKDAGEIQIENTNVNSSECNDISQSIISVMPAFDSPFPELIKRANNGLKLNSPEICSEGVNGTYFLKDENGDKIFVFKPVDEEGNNSPKNETKENNIIPTAGVKEGEAAIREVAAYLLDREGFFGVPKTHMVTIQHHFKEPKTGSLQEFIENDGNAEDFGSRIFPVKEVHKIGVLDVQIMNIDRHAGNVLIKESDSPKNIKLVPIDHGFSLPDNLEVPWFEWMNWSQSKIPFDDETKSYINRIDIEKDAQLLQALGVRNECIKTMKISTKLLKHAVTHNKTLYDIGSIICRNVSKPDEPSSLELLCEKAQQLCQTSRGMESAEDDFFSKLELVMDEFMSN